MKKLSAFILTSAIALASAAPLFSGCGGGKVNYTLSEEGGKHYIVSCSGITGNLTGTYEIPAFFGEGENYAPVTEIAAQGFASCSYSKITVPETITKIGTAAFSFNSLLKTVDFADGINLETISHGAFGMCEKLESIRFPDSVVKTEGLVFSGCLSLTTLEFNSGLKEIGSRAFENCTALEEVSFPQSLTAIGTGAFYNTGLKSVEIPASLVDTEESRGLGYGSFNSCTKLESVKINDGIKIISSGAFGYCKQLKEIYIPLSVEEIEGAYYRDGTFGFGHAFHNDDALIDIYYAGSEEQWKEIKIEYKTAYENNTDLSNEAVRNSVKHYNSW